MQIRAWSRQLAGVAHPRPAIADFAEFQFGVWLWMASAPDALHQNRLSRETSLICCSIKHNPVHWRPWGPDALAEAEATDKPILLSVGYAACHWCHVMAHESFEDRAIAALMNELFVNIKVDREERPDLDQIYSTRLQLLGEQGGWPLTMFLTPEGEPFWGGTYFPPEQRWGRPAFAEVLRRSRARPIATSRDKIAKNVGALSRSAAEARRSRTGRRRSSSPSSTAMRRAAIARDRSGQWRHRRRAQISAMRRSSSCCGALDDAHRRAAYRDAVRACARRACARAASTIISAAVSRAIRSTRDGWCRISRRCSTTTRRSSTC